MSSSSPLVSFVLIIVHVYVCVKLFTFFDLYFVYFLQYSDTVGWVIRPVKTVGRITYIVLAQTLNHAQPTDLTFKLLNIQMPTGSGRVNRIITVDSKRSIIQIRNKDTLSCESNRRWVGCTQSRKVTRYFQK